MGIKTKYSIGDTVWFLHNNRVKHGNVIGIFVSVCSYETGVKQSESYTVRLPVANAEISDVTDAFPSKEDLINSL